jgi:hypothetical protein
MKKTTPTPKMSPQPISATATHTPQLPRDFEQIRQRAQEICRARGGVMGMTLNDWLKAEQELKQALEE